MADQPLDLGTAKACIRRSRMMVSTDSGPRHVAAAFGKPVITLRGPTLPIVERKPDGHGDRSASGTGLHRLPEPRLPAGTSPLHARPVAGEGLPRSGQARATAAPRVRRLSRERDPVDDYPSSTASIVAHIEPWQPSISPSLPKAWI